MLLAKKHARGRTGNGRGRKERENETKSICTNGNNTPAETYFASRPLTHITLLMFCRVQGWNCCAICVILRHNAQTAPEAITRSTTRQPQSCAVEQPFLISLYFDLQYGGQLATANMLGLAAILLEQFGPSACWCLRTPGEDVLPWWYSNITNV